MFELGILNTQITDSDGVINFQLATDSSTIFSHPLNRLLLTSRSDDWEGITNLSIIDKMNEVVYEVGISSEVESNNLYLKVPSKQMTINGGQWQMDSEELLSFNFSGKRISPTLKMHTENSFIQLTAEGNEFNNLLSGDFRNVSVTSLFPENIIQGNPGGQISGSVSYNAYGENSREIKSDLTFSDLRWSDLAFSNLILNGQYKSEKPGDWTLDGYSRLDSAEFVLRGKKPEWREPGN